ncbi:hypothetical protein F5Y15DRAFT_386929 [Xylariaceae sp. FL0016]|nr:hypothetical protein F5Y15DRAFT_386929 [Xylariaceae sp. FL0016]
MKSKVTYLHDHSVQQQPCQAHIHTVASNQSHQDTDPRLVANRERSQRSREVRKIFIRLIFWASSHAFPAGDGVLLTLPFRLETHVLPSSCPVPTGTSTNIRQLNPPPWKGGSPRMHSPPIGPRKTPGQRPDMAKQLQTMHLVPTPTSPLEAAQDDESSLEDALTGGTSAWIVDGPVTNPQCRTRAAKARNITRRNDIHSQRPQKAQAVGLYLQHSIVAIDDAWSGGRGSQTRGLGVFRVGELEIGQQGRACGCSVSHATASTCREDLHRLCIREPSATSIRYIPENWT